MLNFDDLYKKFNTNLKDDNTKIKDDSASTNLDNNQNTSLYDIYKSKLNEYAPLYDTSISNTENQNKSYSLLDSYKNKFQTQSQTNSNVIAPDLSALDNLDSNNNVINPSEIVGATEKPESEMNEYEKVAGNVYNSEGNVIEKKDSSGFVRGYTSTIVDKYINLQGNLDKNSTEKKLTSNTSELLNLGLTAEDIQNIDDVINGTKSEKDLKFFTDGSDKANTIKSNMSQINKLLSDRSNYVNKISGIDDLQTILKERKEASNTAASEGGAEKWGQFSAHSTTFALKVAAGIASSGIATGIVEGAGVTTALANVGLNTTVGRFAVQTLAESVVETGLNALSVKADSDISGTDFSSGLVKEFLYNVAGNALGNIISVGTGKLSDIKASAASAKSYKKLAEFAGVSTDELSKQIKSNPTETASLISDFITKRNISSITGNETLDSLLKDKQSLQYVFNQVSNVEQSKIFTDIMAGNKLSKDELSVLKDILSKSDNLDSEDVDEAIKFIDSKITTSGKATSTTTTTTTAENVDDVSDLSGLSNLSREEKLKSDLSETTVVNKLVNNVDTLTNQELDEFLTYQAKSAGVDITDSTDLQTFKDNFKFSDDIKTLDELKQLAATDTKKYTDVVGNFIRNKNTEISGVKFNSEDVLSAVRDGENTVKVRQANLLGMSNEMNNFTNEQVEAISKATSSYVPSNFKDITSNSVEKIATALQTKTLNQTINDVYENNIRSLTQNMTDGYKNGLSLKEFVKTINDTSSVELNNILKKNASMSIESMSDTASLIKYLQKYDIEPDTMLALQKFMVVQNGNNAAKLAFVKSLNITKAASWYGDMVADDLKSVVSSKIAKTPEFEALTKNISKKTEILVDTITKGGDEKLIQAIYGDIANSLKNSQALRITTTDATGKTISKIDGKFLSSLLNRNTVLAYLFRPSTQIKNIVSNSADYVVDGLSNRFSNAIDYIAFNSGKRGIERGIVSNIKYADIDTSQADEMMKSLDTLIFNYENNIMEASKISNAMGSDVISELKNIKKLGIRDKTFLDKSNKLLTFVMNAGDSPFRTLSEVKATTSIQMTNYYNSLIKEFGEKEGKQAYKNASKEAFYDFISKNPLMDDEKAYVKAIGDYAVKTQDSGFKEFVNNITKSFENKPILAAIKNATMPFTSWSSNALDKAVDLIPGASMLKADNKKILSKFLSGESMTSLEKRTFSQMVGRQLSGTTLTFLGILAYASGKLKVYDEFNTNEREVNTALNVPNFSYQVGDSYIPLDFAEPGSWFVMLGSSIAKADNQYKQKSSDMSEIGASDKVDGYWLTMSKTVLSGIKSMLLDNSVFSQMSVFSDLMSGSNASGSSRSKLLSNASRSLIPFSGLFTDVSKNIDPVRRQTRINQDIIASAGNDLLSNIVPGYSKTLPHQYDITGAIKQRSQIGAITGINTLDVVSNPELEEVLRVYNSVGDGEVIPNARSWTLTSIEKAPDFAYTQEQQNMLKNINLNADEYAKYSYIYGKITSAYIKGVENSSFYQSYDDKQKSVMLKKAISKAGTVAFNYYRQQYYNTSDENIPVIKN